jgi:hypothetical protein
VIGISSYGGLRVHANHPSSGSEGRSALGVPCRSAFYLIAVASARPERRKKRVAATHNQHEPDPKTTQPSSLDSPLGGYGHRFQRTRVSVRVARPGPIEDRAPANSLPIEVTAEERLGLDAAQLLATASLQAMPTLPTCSSGCIRLEKPHVVARKGQSATTRRGAETLLHSDLD